MAAGFPDTGVHEDGSIQAHNVVVKLGHLLPPEVSDVVLEVYAKWTVVIGSIEASIDFGGLEDEAAAAAKRDDFIHCYCHFFFSHCLYS